jgi:hypothetical protein
MTRLCFGNFFLYRSRGSALLHNGVFDHLNVALPINQGHIKAHLCYQRTAGIYKVFRGGFIDAFLLPLA